MPGAPPGPDFEAVSMKFSTRKDIDAPIDHVFASVSDFQVYERAAMRRGAGF